MDTSLLSSGSGTFLYSSSYLSDVVRDDNRTPGPYVGLSHRNRLTRWCVDPYTQTPSSSRLLFPTPRLHFDFPTLPPDLYYSGVEMVVPLDLLQDRRGKDRYVGSHVVNRKDLR